MTICSSHGIKTQEIKGKLSITPFSCTTKWVTRKHSDSFYIHRLANFLNEDQGYESGISMYGHYIACKCLDISSEEEYMNQLTDIRILTNELEPC